MNIIKQSLFSLILVIISASDYLFGMQTEFFKKEAFKTIECIKSKKNTIFNEIVKEKLPENIDDFFEKLFFAEMSHNPQELSDCGIFESIEIYDHNAYLNNVSPDAMRLELEEKKVYLKLLKKYSVQTLSEEQRITYKIILWELEQDVNGEKFLFHKYRITMFGILSYLVEVFTHCHPLKNVQNIDLYLTRLKNIPEQLKQCETLVEYQKNMGIVVPVFVLYKVIDIIQALLVPTIEENVFYVRLANELEVIDVQNKEQLLEKAKNIIENFVYPAYKNLQDCLKKILNENKDNNNGVWALPDGDEYYSHMLKYHTSTDLTADQIHELGKKEVLNIKLEMQKILQEKNIKLTDLLKDPKFYYQDNEADKKQCLKDYELILERSRKELYKFFDLKPKSSVKIEAMPKHEEKDGLSVPYYSNPSLDGSRPGIFCINLGYVHEMPKFLMETITVHESEPGHHFQLALQQESNLPIIQKLKDYTAYVEGWALYVERLAYEANFFSSTFARLGFLMTDLLRAGRLVVDTGIHKKKWTREQAVEYMVGELFFPKSIAKSEVDRYFVWPGQACAYKIGQLKILELRERAKNMLGEKFDIKEFHNTILKLGAAPLSVLEDVINNYIKNK